MEISFCRTVGNSTSLNHRHDTTSAFKVMRAAIADSSHTGVCGQTVRRAHCGQSTGLAVVEIYGLCRTEMAGLYGPKCLQKLTVAELHCCAANRATGLCPQPHDCSPSPFTIHCNVSLQRTFKSDAAKSYKNFVRFNNT